MSDEGSALGVERSAPRGAVFLSYASQDAEAAKRIAEALRAAGVEVWFDQNELRGGDAWDQKIRRQIKECALFVPVISPNTNARAEGYFRLEWKLAVDRSHLLADDHPFLFPVVVGDVNDATARVPDKFREVQWTRLRLDESPGELAARIGRLLGGDLEPGRPRPGSRGEGAAAPALPPGREKKGFERWWWLIFPVMGMAWPLIAVLKPALLRREPPAAAAPTQASAPALSEARKLAQRAAELVNDPNYTRESMWLADELCTRALALDASDAEVWATAAFVGQALWQQAYDPSAARREKVRAQAERAVQLAPNSVFGRLAVARNFALVGDNAEAVRLLRELAREAPANPLLWQNLVWISRRLDREADVAEAIQRLRALDARGALTQALFLEARDLRLRLRYPEAEAVLNELLAGPPSRHAYYERLLLLTRSWHELAETEPFLEKLPLRFQQEPAFGSAIAQYWLYRGEPEKALQALARVPQEFFEEFAAREPKAFLAGWAHAVAGRATAAQAEWRVALGLVEERLKGDPRAVGLLGLKAQLLGLTGQREAAREAWKLRVEFADTANPPSAESVGYFHVAVGENEQAVAAVVGRWPTTSPNARTTLMWALRHSPRLAAIRDDPRIRQLVAEHQAFLDDLRRKSRPAAATPPAGAAPSPAAPAKADDTSVAVLPFANLSGDPAQEYFSDGLTEEILNTLARERDLRVPGRASSFSFKGRNASAAEIAQALGVSRLVEGSVRKSGNRVRISVSLTRASDGFSEELGTFTEELSDVFALQDKVARAVVEKLTRRTVATASVGLTRNAEAYDAYLQGRSLQVRSPGLTPQAIEAYERAVRLDPDFALAWARLAEARFRAYGSQNDRSPALVQATRDAIDRALASQPDLPQALIMRAHWSRAVLGDFAAARRDLERVEALQPANADLRYAQAQLARDSGQIADAFRLYREALQLDPQNGDFTNAYAVSLCLPRGEYVEADQLLRRAMAIQGPAQSVPFGNLVRVRLLWRGPEAALRLVDRTPAEQVSRTTWRVSLLVMLGRLDEARAEAEPLRRSEGPAPALSFVGQAPARLDYEPLLALGWVEEARARAAEDVAAAEREFARDNRAPNIWATYVRALIVLERRDDALAALQGWQAEVARVPGTFRRVNDFAYRAVNFYARLGRVDEAVALIREMRAAGLTGRVGFSSHSDFDPIRADPRYQELVREYEAWVRTLPDPVDL